LTAVNGVGRLSYGNIVCLSVSLSVHLCVTWADQLKIELLWQPTVE